MGTVTVACKLPNGLELVLRPMREHIDEKGQRSMLPVPGGKVTSVKVIGNATKFGEFPHAAASGGYGLTPNVDEDFWNAWVEHVGQHMEAYPKFIFAASRQANVVGKAKEQAELRTRMEPIDPNKPGRGIEPEDKPKFPLGFDLLSMQTPAVANE